MALSSAARKPEPAASATSGSSIRELIDGVAGTSRALLADVDDTASKISEINRTTTVLAMNARVEAARLAGRSGASFAVIAEEMARLAVSVNELTAKVRQRAENRSVQLDANLDELGREVRDTRLCGMALTNIDLIDRNLYERSCDVRWWATDDAVVRCAQTHETADCNHASLRLGQILDSYTVYFDLVIADLDGQILANGRPRQFASIGQSVAQATWFRSALATRSGEEFGFESVHVSSLVDGQRVLVYSCTIREGGKPRGKVLGVLGIVFNWPSLSDTIVKASPLSPAEWASSRVCIVDDHGNVLADSSSSPSGAIQFEGMAKLFGQARGAMIGKLGHRPERWCIAHAASPGYETYRTGWHSLILQRLDD